MKKYDVVALGEVLIDFTFAGKNADGKNLYEENPGGAPANCAAAVAKLGGSAAFIGMTGRDSFGEDIRAALKEINVDTAGIAYTEKQHTTLAFVSLNEKGERSFSFASTPNFCSSSMTSNPKSLNCISFPKILWVPINMSIFPVETSSKICFFILAVVKRLR